MVRMISTDAEADAGQGDGGGVTRSLRETYPFLLWPLQHHNSSGPGFTIFWDFIRAVHRNSKGAKQPPHQRVYYIFPHTESLLHILYDHTGILFTQSCFILAEIPLKSSRSHLLAGGSNCGREEHSHVPTRCFSFSPTQSFLPLPSLGAFIGCICVLTFHFPLSLAPIPLPSFHLFICLPLSSSRIYTAPNICWTLGLALWL